MNKSTHFSAKAKSDTVPTIISGPNCYFGLTRHFCEDVVRDDKSLLIICDDDSVFNEAIDRFRIWTDKDPTLISKVSMQPIVKRQKIEEKVKSTNADAIYIVTKWNRLPEEVLLLSIGLLLENTGKSLKLFGPYFHNAGEYFTNFVYSDGDSSITSGRSSTVSQHNYWG